MIVKVNSKQKFSVIEKRRIDLDEGNKEDEIFSFN
jgi:hypothetical protein